MKSLRWNGREGSSRVESQNVTDKGVDIFISLSVKPGSHTNIIDDFIPQFRINAVGCERGESGLVSG